MTTVKRLRFRLRLQAVIKETIEELEDVLKVLGPAK